MNKRGLLITEQKQAQIPLIKVGVAVIANVSMLKNGGEIKMCLVGQKYGTHQNHGNGGGVG